MSIDDRIEYALENAIEDYTKALESEKKMTNQIKHRIFSVPEKRDSIEVCGDKFDVRELSAYERGQLIEMRDNPTLAQAYIVCCAVDGLDPDTDTDEVYSSVAGHVVQLIADKALELSGLGEDDEKND